MTKQVSATREIAAPPEEIFDVLADPSQHPAIDGSGTVQESQDENPNRLELGSKFGMSMKMGIPYKIRNEVVEFEEGRRIAWRHMGHHVWRYELQPSEQGTVVTETFDWAPAYAGFAYPLMGIPNRNQAAMEATLERLDNYVASARDESGSEGTDAG